MSQNLLNTGTVSAENLPQREIRKHPNNNTDSGQLQQHNHSVSLHNYCLFIVPIVYFLVGT